MRAPKVLFAGGGTGGHLVPGLAVAAELKRRCPQADLLFLGTDKPLERSLVGAAGFSYVGVPARPPGARAWQKPAAAVQLLRAAWKARRVAGRFEPDVILGLGGYGSAGPILYAVTHHRPVVLLEQNVIPGKATRLFARWSEQVCCQFAETVPRLGDAPAVWTGNPLRADIGVCDRKTGADRLGLDPLRRTLLVMGGSQGAQALNEAMLAAAASLVCRCGAPQIVHLAGRQKLDELRAVYARLGLKALVAEFCQDMPAVYAVADLALSRAGGTSMAELAAAGVPSILVPYPFAADNHQRYNAAVFAERQAALLVPQGDLDGCRLSDLLGELLWDEDRLAMMRRATLSLAMPEAAATVVDCLFAVVRAQDRTSVPRAAAL